MNSRHEHEHTHATFTANDIAEAVEQLDKASRCDECGQHLKPALTFSKDGPRGGKAVLYCEACGITKEQTHGNDSPNPAPPEERR